MTLSLLNGSVEDPATTLADRSASSLREALQKRFGHVQLEHEEHRYFSKDGEEYTGISAFIDRFSHAFNTEQISKRVAKRQQKSAYEVQTEWSIRKGYSLVRGTEFHLYAEIYLAHDRRIQCQTPIEHEIGEFHRFWNKNKERYEVVATELTLADDVLKLAGTIDCLVRHRKTGRFYLFDWKTSQAIKSHNPYRNFKAPIEHLSECDVHRYALQSTLYKTLLERNTNLDVSGMFLIHFPRKAIEPNHYNVLPSQELGEETQSLLKAASPDDAVPIRTPL